MKKIILSIALLATGFTCSYASSIEDMTKDALINSSTHTLSGTFGAYDFDPKNDGNKFDWAFTLANGKSYQLRGNAPSDTDVFGWKAVDIVAPKPAWYMFQVDVDGDGLGKFDWVLLGANSNHATKLNGVADSGSFDYTGKLDIDYKVSGNGIVTGAVGTLDETTETPAVDTCANGCSSINFDNLAGHTIFVEDTNGLNISIHETIYVFESATKVKVIVNRNDGGQVVHEDGTYRLSDIPGFKTISVNTSSSGYSIVLDDNFNTQADQLGLFLTKILPNDKNGVVIKENIAVDDGFTIRSVDDLKGYTISSNIAHPGTSGASMQLSIAFECDGSFNYHVDIGYGGRHSIEDYHGDDLYTDEHFDTTRIDWHYLNEDNEQSSDSIQTDVNNQLVEGGCWSGTGSNGTCLNDLHIESITGSGCN